MRVLVIVLLTILYLSSYAVAGDFDMAPICNEISLYKNADDSFNELGQTLQIVSINSFKSLTWFNFEFTGDFNWKLTEGKDYDYYMELSLVKRVTSKLSVNYQRIYGTFVPEPINQFGLRLSL